MIFKASDRHELSAELDAADSLIPGGFTFNFGKVSGPGSKWYFRGNEGVMHTVDSFAALVEAAQRYFDMNKFHHDAA
jgi:hypothetical protein